MLKKISRIGKNICSKYKGRVLILEDKKVNFKLE